jgi:hypothetical protein
MEVFGLTTFRKTSSNPLSVSAAPISRAVSRKRSNWGFSSGGGGLRAGILGPSSCRWLGMFRKSSAGFVKRSHIYCK